MTLTLLFLATCTSAVAAWSGAITTEIWQLPSSTTGARWLIIHNLGTAEKDGIYHIEIIERALGAEVWNIKHVANHLALTPAALRASIIKPLKKGTVYPESFDYAFNAWKKQNAEGSAPVCTTTVDKCLK